MDGSKVPGWYFLPSGLEQAPLESHTQFSLGPLSNSPCSIPSLCTLFSSPNIEAGRNRARKQSTSPCKQPLLPTLCFFLKGSIPLVKVPRLATRRPGLPRV
jgi:hypothetical protein